MIGSINTLYMDSSDILNKLGIDITEMINDFRTTFNFEPKKIERYKDFMIPINELEHKK